MQNDPIGPVVKEHVGDSLAITVSALDGGASKDAEAFYDGNNH